MNATENKITEAIQREAIWVTATREDVIATESTVMPVASNSMSRRRRVSSVSGRVPQPINSAKVVIGSWTKKISLHPPNSNKTAAKAGPPNPRVPHTIEFAANACGLSESGYAKPTDASATAITRPPPIPCNARKIMSIWRLGATAAAKLVRRNQIPVIRNVFRTPIASIIGPAAIAAIAEVARNDVITHGVRDTLPRSFVILGSAATIANPSNAATATTVKFARVIGRSFPLHILALLFASEVEVATGEEYLAQPLRCGMIHN